jgi:hypothetical protein
MELKDMESSFTPTTIYHHHDWMWSSFISHSVPSLPNGISITEHQEKAYEMCRMRWSRVYLLKKGDYDKVAKIEKLYLNPKMVETHERHTFSFLLHPPLFFSVQWHQIREWMTFNAFWSLFVHLMSWQPSNNIFPRKSKKKIVWRHVNLWRQKH